MNYILNNPLAFWLIVSGVLNFGLLIALGRKNREINGLEEIVEKELEVISKRVEKHIAEQEETVKAGVENTIGLFKGILAGTKKPVKKAPAKKKTVSKSVERRIKASKSGF